MATTQRLERRLEKTQETAPLTRARGHLSLVEWDGEVVQQAPKAAAPKRTNPARRANGDRLYTGGVLLLMAATACAIIASFAHL